MDAIILLLVSFLMEMSCYKLTEKKMNAKGRKNNKAKF